MKLDRNGDRALAIYLSRYHRDQNNGNGGLLWAFRRIAAGYGCRRALYPGSYLHITPSLVFPEVCYVDAVKSIEQSITAPALRDYINAHKEYPEKAIIRCYEQDYRDFSAELPGSFDLLISLNAGFISQVCGHFLKPGGYLLANNGHYDANRAYVDSAYRPVAALERDASHPAGMPPDLAPYFQTARGESLTRGMVESDAERPPSKARFRPSRRAEAYLFQRIAPRQ